MNVQPELNGWLNRALATFVADYPETTVADVKAAYEDALADAPTILAQTRDAIDGRAA